ncbi:uncharacterized protein LOC124200011 isoform X6 [Daphnia pulex]|uniref:uncharacterized protein LOC124200011 isoform X6 n=1 Tax=Daphnia pulex TaxID=6669 RepID=UPI001EDF34F1|nr:uncharacterized protein LOC124200011 isoform X6 [Daphnia pulex]
MPQPKWYGKSLSALCMDSIVVNMEKWTASRSSVHVSSLFYLLPSHCLEYMTLEWVKRNHWVTKEMFELLLNPHLKILDLSKLGKGHDMHITDRVCIVRLASVRCSQLTTLKISFFTINQVENTFTPNLQLFEHLQILELSGTFDAGASCMINLGLTDKPKLRELRIYLCPGVTDSVMQVFCNGQSSLQKLSVHETQVTHIGIRFAIEHLPELKELNCDNKSDILKAFRRIRKETRESKKYSLTKCWLMWPPPDEVSYKKGSVSLMVDMCPSLVDVFIHLNDKGFTDEELLGFRKLKQIRNLGIRVSFLPSIISIRGGWK